MEMKVCIFCFDHIIYIITCGLHFTRGHDNWTAEHRGGGQASCCYGSAQSTMDGLVIEETLEVLYDLFNMVQTLFWKDLWWMYDCFKCKHAATPEQQRSSPVQPLAVQCNPRPFCGFVSWLPLPKTSHNLQRTPHVAWKHVVKFTWQKPDLPSLSIVDVQKKNIGCMCRSQLSNQHHFTAKRSWQ